MALPETGSTTADEFIEALERFINIGIEASRNTSAKMPHRRINEARKEIKQKLVALLENARQR